MAHEEQRQFCLSVKAQFPEHFHGKRVLDVGSLDINGSNRFLFDECEYIGIDIGPGRNVDIVTKAHEYAAPDGSFDVVISTECFEHDMYYPLTLRNITRLLKRGGLFLFTCASSGRNEHGTARTTPFDCPLTMGDAKWRDYFKTLIEYDVREAVDIDAAFRPYEFSHNAKSHDLYFWGIRT